MEFLNTLTPILIPVIIAIVAIAVITFIGKVMYKKAPPNVAMVVTGPTGCKTVIGKDVL